MIKKTTASLNQKTDCFEVHIKSQYQWLRLAVNALGRPGTQQSRSSKTVSHSHTSTTTQLITLHGMFYFEPTDLHLEARGNMQKKTITKQVENP